MFLCGIMAIRSRFLKGGRCQNVGNEEKNYGKLLKKAYDNKFQLDTKSKIKKEFIPNANLVKLYEERYNKFKKIYPSVKGLFQELK